MLERGIDDGAHGLFSFRLIPGALVAPLAAAVLVAAPPSACAATDPLSARQVRWEEDYAWLAHEPGPLPTEARWKYVPLADDGEVWLSLGGEVRQRLDLIRSAQLGLSSAGDYDTAQTRLYLHADLHLGRRARLFGQLSYADEGGRPVDRAYDESAPDVQQLFVDLTPVDGARLRLGRQELPLGDQRLSELRETFDLRRSFDAVRLDLSSPDGATLTAFSGVVIVNRPGAFDDRRQSGERFDGLYAALPLGEASALDLFWLSRRRALSTYAEGAARERRETLGARLHGARGSLDYNLYGVGQTGRFGASDIAAWAASADLGWSPPGWAWTPRLGLRADVASGDDRLGDGELNSFDAPYPNTSYLSTSSAYWPGNAWSIFPLLIVHPTPRLDLYLGAQSMSRMSGDDGFYYAAQSPIAVPAGHGQVLMRQVYSRLRWEPVRNWVVSATVIRQAPGAAVRTRGGKASNIVSMSASWKF